MCLYRAPFLELNIFFLNLARKINFAKLVVALVVWTKKQCISIVWRLIYLCIDWMESKHKSAHLHLTYSSGSISNWNESDTPGGKYDHWSIFTQKTKHMYKKKLIISKWMGKKIGYSFRSFVGKLFASNKQNKTKI